MPVATDRHDEDEAAAPQVSVICTARNAAPTIAATIESIIAQEFRDWELIVIDDGSTDDTVTIVSHYAGADPRIRLVATGGIGRGPALNRAIAEAKADLVANIDADDEAHPYLLKTLLEAMQQHPEFAVLSTKWIMVEGANRPRWPEVDFRESLGISDVTTKLAYYNPINHSSVLMRKAAIVGLEGYDEERPSVFDYDLWVRCVASGLRLGRIELPLLAQRIHASQYMYTSRLRYLLAGAKVQVRAMQALGVTRHLPLIPLRVMWGAMPRSWRLGLRDLKLRGHRGRSGGNDGQGTRGS